MISQDSIHFAYLNNYVKQNGWPTRENGGYFAQVIALHDHEKHQYYQPYMKQAVLNDNASNDMYSLLVSYQKTGDGLVDKWLNSPQENSD